MFANDGDVVLCVDKDGETATRGVGRHEGSVRVSVEASSGAITLLNAGSEPVSLAGSTIDGGGEVRL